MRSIILVLVYLTAVAFAANPGFQIFLTQNGLNYIKDIGIDILADQIGNIQIDPITGSQSIDGFNVAYTISEFKFNTVDIPKDASSAAINSPNIIQLTIQKANLDIAATYKVTINNGYWPVTLNGQVDIKSTGAILQENVAVGANNGEPTVTIGGDGTVYLGQLDITFKNAGYFGSILNGIIPQFEQTLSGLLSGVLSGSLGDMLNGVINQLLGELPLHLEIYDGFSLDYSLLDAPAFSTGLIQTDFKGEVFYGSSEAVSITPPAPATFTLSDDMIYLVGTSFVLDTFGAALQESGILHYTLTKDVLDSFGAGDGDYLNTTCTGSCVGSIIPPIGVAYPNSQIYVDMTSTGSPNGTITTDGAFLAFAGDLDFKVGDSPNGQEVFTAHVTLSAIVLGLKVRNVNTSSGGYVISGQVHTTGADLTVKSTTIDQITTDQLDQVWELAAMGVIDGLLNTAVENGINIPSIPYFDIDNPVITPMKDSVLIAANIAYRGGLL